MIKIIATSYINILSQREKSKLDDIKKDYINKTKLNMEIWNKKICELERNGNKNE